jgi:hypothetical protein
LARSSTVPLGCGESRNGAGPLLGQFGSGNFPMGRWVPHNIPSGCTRGVTCCVLCSRTIGCSWSRTNATCPRGVSGCAYKHCMWSANVPPRCGITSSVASNFNKSRMDSYGAYIRPGAPRSSSSWDGGISPTRAYTMGCNFNLSCNFNSCYRQLDYSMCSDLMWGCLRLLLGQHAAASRHPLSDQNEVLLPA